MRNKISKNPLELVTSKFKPLEILHNYGGLVIAQGIWERGSMQVAARWHDADDIGYPNGFGHPQWFLLGGENKGVSKDTSKVVYGQYEQTLTLQFKSLVPSLYLIEYDDAIRSILNYAFANDNIEFIKVSNHCDGPYKHLIVENAEDMILIKDLNLANIEFFRPYAVEMDEESYEAAKMNNASSAYKEVFVKSKEDDGSLIPIYYGYILPQYYVKYSDFTRLGFSVKENTDGGV